ncbi:MAG: CHASE2 domain-containing protein [Bacteriovoracia bacterium]
MNILKAIFKLTPFRLSLLITVFFFVIALLYDINPRNVPLLQTLEQKSIDTKFRIRGPRPQKSKIIIVGADEKAFSKFGQWPFDRGSVFSVALDKLAQLGSRTIGLDIVWTDPEHPISKNLKTALSKTVGSSQLENIIEQNSGDRRLGKVIEKHKDKIVLGYAPTRAESSNIEEYNKRVKNLLTGNNIIESSTKGRIKYSRWPGDPEANVDYYLVAKSGTLNIPEITPQGVAQGFFNNEPDDDGNYRRALLFYNVDDFFVPSLPLRMAQKAFGKEMKPTLFMQGDVPERRLSQELKLSIPAEDGSERKIPVDLRGMAFVNFRGPNYTFPHVSLAELFTDSDMLEYELADSSGIARKISAKKAEFFKDAWVILGVTALALYDVRPRSLDEQAFGVENHANILDNILNNDFLFRPTSEIFLALWIVILLISTLYGFALTKLSAKWGAIFAFSVITGTLVFDQYVLFPRNILYLSSLQAAQYLMQYIGVTILKYMQEESDKKFIRSAFDKYVSPAIVDSMLKDPKKLKLGGDKKELSVMFSDIASFTDLSEKMDVKSLTGFLNEYLGAMTDILQNNSGTLDKYIGDAVMGFWGAPIDLHNHAELAVKTAVQMMSKVDELNQLFSQKYDGLKISVRIGINTGPVSVGNFGSNKVFAFTIIGDDVNLASRLEGINKFYGTNIIISESTRDKLPPNTFLTREVDTVKVKGKQKPVKIFQVIPDGQFATKVKPSLDIYNEALSSYYSQKWKEAKQAFESFLKAVGEDQPSLEMLKRIQYYLENPPEADWDGSWKMTSK